MLLWRSWQLRSRKTNTRVQAAISLGESNDPRALKLLIRALEDEDSMVRLAVVHAVGKIGDLCVLESLIKSTKDKDETVRRHSREALDKIDSNWVKSEIAKKVIPDLIAVLNDCDVRVRQDVSEVLGRMGDERALSPLVTLLKDNCTWRQAREALDKIASNWRVSGAAKTIIPDLLATLETRNMDGAVIRTHEADVLVEIGAEVVEPLIIMIKKTGGAMKVIAADILGEIGDARALGPLVMLLKDKSVTVKQAAKEALNKKNWTNCKDAKSSIPYLIAALDDAEESIQAAAAKSLGKLGDSQALDALEAKLDDPSDKVVANVVAALLEIKPDWGGSESSKRAIPRFTILLRRSDLEANLTSLLRNISHTEFQKLIDGMEMDKRQRERWISDKENEERRSRLIKTEGGPPYGKSYW